MIQKQSLHICTSWTICSKAAKTFTLFMFTWIKNKPYKLYNTSNIQVIQVIQVNVLKKQPRVPIYVDSFVK